MWLYVWMGRTDVAPWFTRRVEAIANIPADRRTSNTNVKNVLIPELLFGCRDSEEILPYCKLRQNNFILIKRQLCGAQYGLCDRWYTSCCL